jgi:ATP-dependent DNA helicase
MDAQAQDRAHRIGQTRPVLIFRLVSAHTVETKIMQRATEKRKLEVLVIAKGNLKAFFFELT